MILIVDIVDLLLETSSFLVILVSISRGYSDFYE